jgi:hypothetical protein
MVINWIQAILARHRTQIMVYNEQLNADSKLEDIADWREGELFVQFYIKSVFYIVYTDD